MTVETINQNLIETQEANPTFLQRVSQGLLGILTQAAKQPEHVRTCKVETWQNVDGEMRLLKEEILKLK
jgi:hypothetical protein